MRRLKKRRKVNDGEGPAGMDLAPFAFLRTCGKRQFLPEGWFPVVFCSPALRHPTGSSGTKTAIATVRGIHRGKQERSPYPFLRFFRPGAAKERRLRQPPENLNRKSLGSFPGRRNERASIPGKLAGRRLSDNYLLMSSRCRGALEWPHFIESEIHLDRKNGTEQQKRKKSVPFL